MGRQRDLTASHPGYQMTRYFRDVHRTLVKHVILNPTHKHIKLNFDMLFMIL